MIGGFALGGNSNAARVVVSAAGPSLAAVGINNLLANPTRNALRPNGQCITFNDTGLIEVYATQESANNVLNQPLGPFPITDHNSLS